MKNPIQKQAIIKRNWIANKIKADNINMSANFL